MFGLLPPKGENHKDKARRRPGKLSSARDFKSLSKSGEGEAGILDCRVCGAGLWIRSALVFEISQHVQFLGIFHIFWRVRFWFWIRFAAPKGFPIHRRV